MIRSQLNPALTEFLTGPELYKDNIYYVEIKWDGYAIANSNKKYQFQLASWSSPWDTSDDWSAQGMLKIDNSEYNGYSGEMQKAPNICVYSNGVLIGGTEPDGTTPIVSAGAGDLNKDGKITVADIVLLQKYLVKRMQKYLISRQQMLIRTAKLIFLMQLN